MAFKERLKELRTENKLKQKELAEKIGYAQSIISDWENGTSEPSLSALIELAKAFETDLNDLTEFEAETKLLKKNKFFNQQINIHNHINN